MSPSSLKHLFAVVCLLALGLTACPAPKEECGPGFCFGCCSNGICSTGTEATSCGSAGQACTACGAGQTCSLGLCQTSPPGDGGGGGGGQDAGYDGGGGGDCRDPGATCPAKTYCEVVDGKCKPGCSHNADCDVNGYCDLVTHGCRCDAGRLQCGTACLACQPPAHATAVCNGGACDFGCQSGYHRCGTACLSNTSPGSCGSACTPCPVPAGGSATCDGTACGTSCPGGTRMCGGACALCPTSGVAQTACSGSACAATACLPTFVIAGNGCQNVWSVQSLAADPSRSPMLAVSPDGTPAVAWEVASGTGPQVAKIWTGGTTQTTSLSILADMTFTPAGQLQLVGMTSSGSSITWLVPGVNGSGAVVTGSYLMDAYALVADSSGMSYVVGATSSSIPKGFLLTTTGWVEETLSLSFNIGDAQAALGPDGRVWALLAGTGSNTFRLAHRETSGWVLDAPMTGRYHPAFALRSDSVPVIASSYSGGSASILVTSGAQGESINTGALSPYWVAVAVDAANAPHIVFEVTGRGIYYTSKRTGAWTIEQLSATDSYLSPSVGIGSDGVVHVAWSTANRTDVMYAKRQ
ncbi:MAG: hypothetical protein ACYC8T_04560 [Myxococcaceae bacterium]